MPSYGYGTTTISAEPTSLANLTADTAAVFSFSASQGRVVVQNSPASPDTLKVVFNDDSSSPTVAAAVWEFALDAGQAVYSPPGIRISTVGLYSASNLTKGTHFNVRGWE